jgi:hypothetical protein
MRVFLRIFVRFVVPAFIAVAGSIIALDRIDWPAHAWFPRWAILVSVQIPIVGSLLISALSQFGENKHYRRLKLEGQLRHILVTPLLSAIDDCGGNWRGVSVHAYEVQKVRLKRSLFREERQIGIGKFGLSALGSSGVHWTKGKGVIGQCWEKQKDVAPDLQEFGLMADKPKEWKGWGTAKVFNLSYDDYQRTGSKYCTIAAVPMTDHKGNYIGCVVVNSADRLKNLELVMPRLRQAAEIIVAVLQKPSE